MGNPIEEGNLKTFILPYKSTNIRNLNEFFDTLKSITDPDLLKGALSQIEKFRSEVIELLKEGGIVALKDGRTLQIGLTKEMLPILWERIEIKRSNSRLNWVEDTITFSRLFRIYETTVNIKKTDLDSKQKVIILIPDSIKTNNPHYNHMKTAMGKRFDELLAQVDIRLQTLRNYSLGVNIFNLLVNDLRNINSRLEEQ